jgi:acyl-CoA oxidase
VAATGTATATATAAATATATATATGSRAAQVLWPASPIEPRQEEALHVLSRVPVPVAKEHTDAQPKAS